jgi:hypothetical protein
MAAGEVRDPNTGGLVGLPHFAPRARRVIFLHQSGGPSQLETFDYKPQLAKYQGTEIPDSVRMGQRIAQTMGQSLLPIAKSQFGFSRHGQSGTWVSDLLPHTAKIVDDITVIKTMYTDAINHDPAITFIQTGFQQPGRPSMGAWLSYGLGSENQNLPAFVVLLSQAHAINTDQPLFSRLWASGFLPSAYQGVRFRAGAEPVLYLEDPPGITATTRRQMLDAVSALNAIARNAYGDPEIETRIAQYEMAYRMQTSVPELMDLSKEPDSVFEMYGPESRKPGTYAANCLLARRLAERDVRFIQLYHRGWDQHRRPAARHRAAVPRHRSAHRGAHHGPQAARPARRHARRLGRRVRPHGLQPGQALGHQLRARPPSAQLLHVGRRRRHEDAATSSARPTTSATTSRRIRCRSSTCRRRSCTCWGSITSGSRTGSRGGLPVDRRARGCRGKDACVILRPRSTAGIGDPRSPASRDSTQTTSSGTSWCACVPPGQSEPVPHAGPPGHRSATSADRPCRIPVMEPDGRTEEDVSRLTAIYAGPR